MENEFLTLLAEALEINDRELLLTDEFRNYPEWDSLALLSVIAMIDDEYEVIIDGNDFAKLRTNADLVEAIKSQQ